MSDFHYILECRIPDATRRLRAGPADQRKTPYSRFFLVAPCGRDLRRGKGRTRTAAVN